MTCPSADTWVALTAGELDEPSTSALRTHAALCLPCRKELEASAAICALGDHPGPSLQQFNERLEERIQATRRRPHRPLAVAALLCAGLLSGVLLTRTSSELVARGGDEGSWTKRVAAEVRPVSAVARPLEEGAPLSKSVPLAVWYRNAESRAPLFLMAYLVDAHGELHWIAPMYVTQGHEPGPRVLPVALGEAVLEGTVLPDSPALGDGTLITVVSRAAGSVLALEGAPRGVRLAPDSVFPDVVVWRRPVRVIP